ncbi:MAG: 50S ribosomal protein L3 [Patescibacteria group bacterium]|nr:50S ribosomal protein L3 [Patescibacteria group bacterium]
MDDNFQSNNEIGKNIDDTFLEDIKTVEVKGISKGKGYQGVMKRFHLQG